ncbi:MAG: alkaline phosphatase family protein, partial [Bacteroidota bacterium]
MMPPRLRLLLLLLIFALGACLPLPPGPPLPRASSSPPPPTGTYTPSPLPVPEPISAAVPPLPPPVTRVVIISIDGLRPDAIDKAPMPVLQELMRTGAYSLTAQTTIPSSTLPGHTSMLSGLCPSAHGVDW